MTLARKELTPCEWCRSTEKCGSVYKKKFIYMLCICWYELRKIKMLLKYHVFRFHYKCLYIRIKSPVNTVIATCLRARNIHPYTRSDVLRIAARATT